MFQKISDIQSLEEKIKQNKLVFVYFGQPGCSVCHSLKPQIEKKLSTYQNDVLFLEVNTLEIPEVAGAFQIMTAPVTLLFVEGQEYMRKARIIPLNDLEQSVAKIVTGVLQTEN